MLHRNDNEFYRETILNVTGTEVIDGCDERMPSAATSPTSSSSSRTTSPLTTSAGILTKRGPQIIEQTQVSKTYNAENLFCSVIFQLFLSMI